MLQHAVRFELMTHTNQQHWKNGVAYLNPKEMCERNKKSNRARIAAQKKSQISAVNYVQLRLINLIGTQLKAK